MIAWTMPEYLENFLKAFVPIFFAVDAIGVLPMFISLTDEMEHAARQRVVKQGVVTALLVAIGFIFFGQWLFERMGITVSDFMVAGGVLLFVIATLDLVRTTKVARQVPDMIGAVPLGTPLIVGPATLTMAIILVDAYGLVETLLAIVVNICIAGAVFLGGESITRVLGPAGSRAVSKVASIILAAIAVMMIRKGLPDLVAFVEKAAGG